MKFPIFFEDSKIPVILSKIGPIEIGAISLGIAVFSRGKMNIIAKDKTTNVMFSQKRVFLHFV